VQVCWWRIRYIEARGCPRLSLRYPLAGEEVQEFVTIFMALIFETIPFLLAGVALSVVAGRWVQRALAAGALQSPGIGMVAGASAGLVLPVCDCGSRPLAHRLALAGRRDFAVAFLVAAPVINPIVIVTTWLAFRDAEFVGLRLGVTFLMALVAGLVLARFRGEVAVPTLAASAEGEAAPLAWGDVPFRVLSEFLELFQFLVFGAALAAGLQVFFDESVLTSAHGVYISVLAMMALAFVLSICSSVDAFVVAGLGGAVGTGPALAFLTFGPLVNLKSGPMYLRLFRPGAVAVLGVLIAQLVFVAAVTAELRGW
jgi:uncharacterized membrane protein YraQ (UPF0718 family)